MFEDIYGFSGENFGTPVDPLGLTWGMFETSGNPAFYMLYKNLFDLDSLEEDERFR